MVSVLINHSLLSLRPLCYVLFLKILNTDPCRTTDPAVHWIVPILSGIPFGTGVAQILQSLTTYLMDAYDIYFASAIAATIVLRSICGAVFPLFSPSMFAALGDAWAMSLFAFLSFVCMPIPMLFWVGLCIFLADR